MALTATQTPSERILGNGDRFFTFIRWLVLGLAFVIDVRLNNRLVIPPTISSFALVWWGYAGFALVLSAGRFIPTIDQLMPWAFVGDLAFLSVLGIVGNMAPELLYPLFIPTTIWAALRRTSQGALISGLMAAVAYIIATLLIQRQDGAIVLSNTTLLGLAINVVMLVFIAWLTSVLASHSSDTNRLEVAAAQRNVETARQEAESYRDRMRALYEVAFRLSTTMNFQTVLDATVQESQKIIDGTVSLVLLPTGEPDELYVAAGKGLQPNDLNKRVVVNPTGIIGSTFASGTPQIVDNVQISPAIQSIQSLHTIKSVCCVPLSAGRRNYGLLLVGTSRPTPFRAEELEMVTALANYAIIAMLNAQLGTEIHQERVKLIDKEEQVRQQLARDLHDGPAQSVAAITMNIDFVKRLLERDPSRVEQELSKLGELARRTTYDIRTLLFELRPLSLDSQGLIATLREYAQRFKDGPTQVIVEEAVGDLRLETKREGTVFNIVQEAVNNAMKHAQAKHIWIRLQRQGDELMATVQDDGKGFDLQAIRQNYHQRGSFGLLNIEERAQMVGGSAELNSAPGAGTTVRVIVPIDATSI